jgi:hypothetical protein
MVIMTATSSAIVKHRLAKKLTYGFLIAPFSSGSGIINTGHGRSLMFL